MQSEHGDCYDSYYDPTEFQSLVSVALGALDCGTVTISGVENFPQCNGDYRPTGQYSRGLMVFKHSTSKLFLCCLVNARDWRVTNKLAGENDDDDDDDKTKTYIIRSADSLCPASEPGDGSYWWWRRWNGKKNNIKSVGVRL